MIQCPFCHADQVQNTIFCGECGYCLLEDAIPPTDPLDMEEVNRRVVDASGNSGPVQSTSWPLVLHLMFAHPQREIEVPLANKAICLGRLDPTAHVFPEVDLTGANGVSKSVSRRHARILRQGDTVVIEDLGSINGTFINGRRLAPYLPETLGDGDVLQLGKLLIEVKIEKS